jgi:hypothetical protein
MCASVFYLENSRAERVCHDVESKKSLELTTTKCCAPLRCEEIVLRLVYDCVSGDRANRIFSLHVEFGNKLNTGFIKVWLHRSHVSLDLSCWSIMIDTKIFI